MLEPADRERLQSIETTVVEILRLVRLSLIGEAIIMTTQADIDAKTAALNAKLTAETNAEKAVQLLLADTVKALADVSAKLAAANPTLDLSALDAIGAGIDANAAAAAAAVVANTPAAPVPAAAPTSPVT